MTVGELRKIIAGQPDDAEVNIHVTQSFDGYDSESDSDTTYIESERVPLDSLGTGWFECESCGAVHTVKPIIADQRLIEADQVLLKDNGSEPTPQR